MNQEDFEIIPKLSRPDSEVCTVVLSTDNTYAPYAGITLLSFLESVSPERLYDITILDDGISLENQTRLREIVDPVDFAEIRFIEVSHLASDGVVHGQFSKATYLRLFIPCLFRGHKKVLYLDCDLIIQKDVSELFDLEFENEYIAAVRDIGMAEYSRTRTAFPFKGRRLTWRKYLTKYLRFPKGVFEEGVNTGVVLFNIPAFEQEDFAVLEGVDHHIRFGYFLVDQCVANILFKGRIKFLPMQWNLQVQQRAPRRLSPEMAAQYREAEASPGVLHYVTHFKPWRKAGIPFSAIFWAVAEKTVWYRQIYEQMLSTDFQRWINRTQVEGETAPPGEPLISVIMPLYNREELVEKSLHSILIQDFRNFEIILIDDASTDATVQVIQTCAKKDARIRLIRLETNQGPGPARNAGIAQARGKYIRICDSDDFYPPGALAACARQVEKEDFDLVAGNWTRWLSVRQEVQLDPDFSYVETAFTSGDLMELKPLWSLLHFSRCMFRREFLLANGIEYPAMRRAEDPVYMARVLSRAKSFALIQAPVYLCHIRPRDSRFTYQEACDAYSAYPLISQVLMDAGFRKIAFVFHFFLSSLQFDYVGFTEEQSLDAAKRLIDSLKDFELEELKNPVLKECGFDYPGLLHDLLLIKNATPELLADWIQRRLLSGIASLEQEKQGWLVEELSVWHRRREKLQPLIRIKKIAGKIRHFLQRRTKAPGRRIHRWYWRKEA